MHTAVFATSTGALRITWYKVKKGIDLLPLGRGLGDIHGLRDFRDIRGTAVFEIDIIMEGVVVYVLAGIG
jgi:hypothetical protein